MSWSFGFVVAPGGNYEALFSEANAAFHAQQEGYNQPASQEVDDQITAAGTAARAIVLSQSVGDNDDTTKNVTLSGHANLGHAPSSGYANDYIQVSVVQVT